MNDQKDSIDHSQRDYTRLIQNGWWKYLQIGNAFSIVGGIGLWIWFMTLWGLWGLFLGWIPAALIGWFMLRFMWLPALLACLWLLFYALDYLLPQQIQFLVLKVAGVSLIVAVISSQAGKKKNDES